MLTVHVSGWWRRGSDACVWWWWGPGPLGADRSREPHLAVDDVPPQDVRKEWGTEQDMERTEWSTEPIVVKAGRLLSLIHSGVMAACYSGAMVPRVRVGGGAMR